MSILAVPLLGVKTTWNRLALKPEASEHGFSELDTSIGSAVIRGAKKETKHSSGVNNLILAVDGLGADYSIR